MTSAGASAAPGDPQERLLRALAGGGETLALVEAALALAARRDPLGDPRLYAEHLALLAADVRQASGAATDVAGRAQALASVIAGRHGYHGDAETYDDLQNADLRRVIDRRKGLPVALGILYIHCARAQGWSMRGLAFPGHFLVRLEEGVERAIIDPFHGGAVCGAAELRALLKATGGPSAELDPAHYETVSDRQILLRLQNNIKQRLLRAERYAEALATVEDMLLFAPDEASLWWESGLLNARLDNIRAAIAALEEYLRCDGSESARRRTAALLPQLKNRLN
jgi:regulator of sirC expression with transglutaminase-like and TPR domain